MAKCRGNDIGSLILNRATTSASAGESSRYVLWKSFSAVSLRRKFLSVIRCGGTSISRRHRRKSAELPAEIYTSGLEKDAKPLPQPGVRSEKLCDLLNLAELHERRENEAETEKKVEALEKLKRAVEELHSTDFDGGKAAVAAAAARDVRSIAKDNAEARATLAMLGAIPPLIGMLHCADLDSQISALYSLLNLGIGNDMNKAAIVKAGAVHKMLKLIKSPVDPLISEAIAANFLGLSALDSNKAIIGSSGAIPFLVDVILDLDHRSSPQATQDALRALYNLSIYPVNVGFILETNLVPFLMDALGDMEVSERILSILSNIVSTTEGRKAISAVPDAFSVLVDVLNWNDMSVCQEKASYILMVMAHKSYGNRQAMIEAGIISALLELTLIGSTLSQKRASRILECLRVNKGKQVSEKYGSNMSLAVSAPICGSSSISMFGVAKDDSKDQEDDMMSEEKKAVKQLVRQSLHNNMQMIAKRANLPQDFVPSDHLKSLTMSSTSKSLPF